MLFILNASKRKCIFVHGKMFVFFQPIWKLIIMNPFLEYLLAKKKKFIFYSIAHFPCKTMFNCLCSGFLFALDAIHEFNGLYYYEWLNLWCIATIFQIFFFFTMELFNLKLAGCKYLPCSLFHSAHYRMCKLWTRKKKWKIRNSILIHIHCCWCVVCIWHFVLVAECSLDFTRNAS